MISKRLQQFDSSSIRKAFELANEIPDPIDLSIGYPEDNTPDYIKSAGISAIKSNQTRYTPSNGILELRSAIASKLNRDNQIKVTADEVTITPGVTTAILLIYLALLDPGDEVLLPDPFFPPYRDLANMLGAKAVLVDTFPTFQLTAKAIEEKITPRTKALVLNSPNNPSGAIYPESELREIAKLAQKHALVIISDEIYENFSYNQPHFSIGSIYHNTLTLNGFSKAYAMTGWRIGYIAGPMNLIGSINELQQYVVFSSSSIGQRAALAAFRHSPLVLTNKYWAKRDYAIEQVGKFCKVDGGQGAFYIFMKLPKGVNDLEFVEQAAKAGLIILPSSAFSAHNDYIRITYAGKRTTLRKGITILKRLYAANEMKLSTAKLKGKLKSASA